MTSRRAVLSGVLATLGGLALSGCTGAGKSEHGEPSPIDTMAMEAPLPGARAAVVQGALVYREPVILPPEAMARVQLVRLGPNRVARGVLATVWVAGPMAPPVPFRLTWNPRQATPLAADERLAVVAMVMVGEEVLFTSLAPAALVPNGRPVMVPLLARWGGVDI